MQRKTLRDLADRYYSQTFVLSEDRTSLVRRAYRAGYARRKREESAKGNNAKKAK